MNQYEGWTALLLYDGQLHRVYLEGGAVSRPFTSVIDAAAKDGDFT